MRKDPSTFIVGEGIGARGGCFGQTLRLFRDFGPERVLDMPISEAGFVGMCAGAAACGSRAIVDIMFVDFAALAMDQIVNQAAKLRYMSGGQYEMPLTIVGVSGAAQSGGPHHSQSLHPWFMSIPGIIVVLPSNGYDMKGLLASAVLENDLAVVLPHKGLLNSKWDVPEEDYTLPLGEARIVREGTDATVVATGMMVQHALVAAEELSAKGISAEVIDPRTLVPLDENTIVESVKRTKRLVVVDEGYSTCGVGAEITARVQEKAFDFLDAPVQRVHPLSAPVPFSPVLENAVIPDAQRIIAAVMGVV
jgi:pyruvate dehydrogenase E1 component beta subunit